MGLFAHTEGCIRSLARSSVFIQVPMYVCTTVLVHVTPARGGWLPVAVVVSRSDELT